MQALANKEELFQHKCKCYQQRDISPVSTQQLENIQKTLLQKNKAGPPWHTGRDTATFQLRSSLSLAPTPKHTFLTPASAGFTPSEAGAGYIWDITREALPECISERYGRGGEGLLRAAGDTPCGRPDAGCSERVVCSYRGNFRVSGKGADFGGTAKPRLSALPGAPAGATPSSPRYLPGQPPSPQRAPASPRPCGRAPAPFGEHGAADRGCGHPPPPPPPLPRAARPGPAMATPLTHPPPPLRSPPRSPALRGPGTHGSGPCGGSASPSAPTAHGSPRRAASEHVRAPGMRSAGGEAAALPPPSPAVSSAGAGRPRGPADPPPSSPSGGRERGAPGSAAPTPLRPRRRQEPARSDYIVRDKSILLIRLRTTSVRVPVAYNDRRTCPLQRTTEFYHPFPADARLWESSKSVSFRGGRGAKHAPEWFSKARAKAGHRAATRVLVRLTYTRQTGGSPASIHRELCTGFNSNSLKHTELKR